MVCIMIQNKTNKNVSNNNKLIFLLSKIQALHIILLYLQVGVVIIYSVMMQYYSVKHKHTSKESGLQD